MELFWKVIGAIAALGTIASAIGIFYSWHSKTYKELGDRIRELELKNKDLENTSKNHQTIIDQLPNLMPVLHQAVEQIGLKKKK